MSKNPGSGVALTSGIIACLVLSLSIQAIASPPALISDSGQKLSSVFQGLKANPRLADYQPLRRPWRGVLQSRLPGLLPVTITENAFCPTTTCEGNYAVIVPSFGCMSSGCDDITNLITDTDNGFCTQGAMDVECGDGITNPCCANWVECPSPDVIGCTPN